MIAAHIWVPELPSALFPRPSELAISRARASVSTRCFTLLILHIRSIRMREKHPFIDKQSQIAVVVTTFTPGILASSLVKKPCQIWWDHRNEARCRHTCLETDWPALKKSESAVKIFVDFERSFSSQVDFQLSRVFGLDERLWSPGSAPGNTMRQLKYHEQKLLKKVNFLQWKSDQNVREIKVLRRYHVQVMHQPAQTTDDSPQTTARDDVAAQSTCPAFSIFHCLGACD